VFEERMLRKIFGLKRTRQHGNGENCTLLGRSNQGGEDGRGMTYRGEKRIAYRISRGKTRQETTWKTNTKTRMLKRLRTGQNWFETATSGRGSCEHGDRHFEF
jgi:hypothetical protein